MSLKKSIMSQKSLSSRYPELNYSTIILMSEAAYDIEAFRSFRSDISKELRYNWEFRFLTCRTTLISTKGIIPSFCPRIQSGIDAGLLFGRRSFFNLFFYGSYADYWKIHYQWLRSSSHHIFILIFVVPKALCLPWKNLSILLFRFHNNNTVFV